MIPLDVITFYLLYTGVGLLFVFGLWIYFDQKDKQRLIPRQSKVIFHCIKCSQIYTGAHGSEEGECPRCHFNNSRLRF
ncbi:MAG: hydrogenase nickel incorporation protein HypA [Puniceicoccaceae bacterium MED-G30]|nr:MAG: hydrogenase nickel incorporation protein HypA [Puniceicoccaceae bacterium MED-G30]RPG86082.1 MAG: hydrogenase nickel incorporation protein HypA [Coraliomargarita sp. TMED73]